jgi:hypothetical protein
MSMIWIAGFTGNGSNSPSFQNIPQTFSHLQLRVSCRSTGAATYGTNDVIAMTFNNDTGNNYAHHYLVGGDGTSATTVFSGGFPNVSYVHLGWNATSTSNTNVFSSSITDILDYTNTTKNKTVRLLEGYEDNRNGFGFGCSWFGSSLWINSSTAVNRIDLRYLGGGSFATGSRADLYGMTTSLTTGA